MTIINYAGVSVHIVPKKIKHSYLRVKTDGSILMTVNKRLNETQIQHILHKHIPKLRPQIELARLSKQATNDLVHGSTIHYLGQTYQLNLIQTSSTQVLIQENIISISLSEIDNLPVKLTLLQHWYRKQAEAIFLERFTFWLAKIQHWEIVAPKLAIRPMHSRWGSYSKRTHKVCLNLWLIKAPLEIIDYIIAHEFTHLVHYNHSKLFYNQLSQLMPNWQEKRRELNQIAKQYCHA
ncbi:MAG: M48 family metallopeptidase [Burkholderiales bacterium]